MPWKALTLTADTGASPRRAIPTATAVSLALESVDSSSHALWWHQEAQLLIPVMQSAQQKIKHQVDMLKAHLKQ